MNKGYYIHNQKYSHFLNQGDVSTFAVYLSAIKRFLSIKGKFLDVGCGPGIVVDSLAKEGISAFGIEVSKSSLEFARQRSGSFKLYAGARIPFPDSTFSVVGSIDVIEHVQDVTKFLSESLRVLQPGGHLIICTPNFLSLTSSYHYRTSGLLRKLYNLIGIIRRAAFYFVSSGVVFEKFAAINRPDFHPDDDATNLINPLDIFKWGRENHLALVYYSGSFMPPGFISYHLGKIPLWNLISGGVFVVFKK